jgi:hypothetical protein
MSVQLGPGPYTAKGKRDLWAIIRHVLLGYVRLGPEGYPTK